MVGTSAGDLPFTESARRLLAGARGESDRLRHEYVGTEHLALALAREPDTLAPFGVDAARVRALLEEKVVPGHAAPAPDGERPYTSRTLRAFALAGESAREAGHAHVGVEHLLVGMLRERMNFGAQILQHCGLTAEQTIAQVRRLGTDDTLA